MTRSFIAVCALFVTIAAAPAQHALHHATYQNWVNKNDKGCCNDKDCDVLADENERVTAGGVEVKVEGTWCPVLSFHYLKRGNTPDWSSSHVCVQRQGMVPVPVCARLLCFQPKPGI